MKQILVNYPIDENAVEKIRKGTPDLFATSNGEEVLAMVRDGEVERVCIAFGACGFSEFELSNAIHTINPMIPVLVLGSDLPEKSTANEYVTNDAGFFFESVNEFLNGEFTEEDYRLFPRMKAY